LAVVVPDWVLAHSHPDWLDRSSARVEDYWLPERKDGRIAFATVIGADGLALLQAVDAADAPEWLRRILAIQTLRWVWIQKYTWTAHVTLRWRTNDEIPPSGQYLSSSYDQESCSSQKRSTSWVGYNVHLTERFDADLPHRITHVETTMATTSDDAVTEQIHASLKQRDLLPEVHSTDTGSIDAALRIESERQ
jgi:transposase